MGGNLDHSPLTHCLHRAALSLPTVRQDHTPRNRCSPPPAFVLPIQNAHLEVCRRSLATSHGEQAASLRMTTSAAVGRVMACLNGDHTPANLSKVRATCNESCPTLVDDLAQMFQALLSRCCLLTMQGICPMKPRGTGQTYLGRKAQRQPGFFVR